MDKKQLVLHPPQWVHKHYDEQANKAGVTTEAYVLMFLALYAEKHMNGMKKN